MPRSKTPLRLVHVWDPALLNELGLLQSAGWVTQAVVQGASVPRDAVVNELRALDEEWTVSADAHRWVQSVIARVEALS